MLNVLAVGPFRCCRETEKHLGHKVIEQPCVGGRGSVVELIHNDDVELLGVEVFEVQISQGLDGAEDVLPVNRPTATNILLAKRGITEYLAEGRSALRQDLVAMRD